MQHPHIQQIHPKQLWVVLYPCSPNDLRQSYTKSLLHSMLIQSHPKAHQSHLQVDQPRPGCLYQVCFIYISTIQQTFIHHIRHKKEETFHWICQAKVCDTTRNDASSRVTSYCSSNWFRWLLWFTIYRCCRFITSYFTLFFLERFCHQIHFTITTTTISINISQSYH